MLLERTEQITVKRLSGSAEGRLSDGQTPLLYGDPALHQLAELVLEEIWQYDNERCLPYEKSNAQTLHYVRINITSYNFNCVTT